jgi:mannose-6-phosphate isomerase-like protein (cupin superfamily)
MSALQKASTGGYVAREAADSREDHGESMTKLPGHLTLDHAQQRLAARTDGKRFIELFKHGRFSVELYAPRGTDPQQPHKQDEAYVVIRGSGEFQCGGKAERFGPNDVMFVPAGVEHRFVNFSDDLAVWVFFYGPEGGEKP